jgi:hypothetical protein
LGTAALAKTTDQKPQGQQMSADAEIALRMWQQHMGDKPMPERLRQKYGIPAQPQPGFPPNPVQ